MGFDFSKFANLEQSQGWLRRQFHIASDEIVVGIVGRLAPIKNHHLFLECAKRLADANAPFRMVIIGDGELRTELENYAKQLGLGDYVIFTGWLQDPCQIYADLDIVALTSLNEGTPVTLIEAMHCGKPVVATKVGGVADIVQNDIHGVLVPSQDVDGFTQAILSLQDASLREKYGQAGKQNVTRFAIARLLQDLDNLYQELLPTKYRTGS